MSPRNSYTLILSLMLSISCVPVHAEPSVALGAALISQCPAQQVAMSYPLILVKSLLEAANAKFNVGFEAQAETKWGSESVDVPAGTLRAQIDFIANTKGYSWESYGDRLIFFPKSANDDPNYVMNKHIPGEIIICPCAEETSIKPWFRENGISSIMLVHGGLITIDYSKIAQNRVVLKDPTLREFMSAKADVYGTEYYYVNIVRISNPTKPGEVKTSLYETINRLWTTRPPISSK